MAQETGQNDCSCDRCKSACEYKPGWFHPDQIVSLAKSLGLSIEQLFKQHLSVDWWAGDSITAGQDIFVLSPRLNGEAGGKMFPANPHGTCHWFRGGKCEIHLTGKPAECAFAHHDIGDAELLRHRLAVVTAWMPYQNAIARLLGRPPSSVSL